MDRAGKLLRRINLPGARPMPEDIVRAAWPHAVGKVVAGHTRVSALYGRRLIVEVEDSIWRTQLETLAPQILARLKAAAGPETIDRIEFRHVPPKRQPQRAAESKRTQDEANRIEDPVLRMAYRASRKRSLA